MFFQKKKCELQFIRKSIKLLRSLNQKNKSSEDLIIDIKMMTEEAYRTLKKNYEEVYKMICDHPSDSSWLKDYLGFEPYEVKKYVIDDFELKIADDYKTVEFDNDIKLYETLNKLPK